MLCLTSGYLTTSTTPTLIASIMYVLEATSSSSCISTIATSFAIVVNRPKSGDVAVVADAVPGCIASRMIGATCSSSTRATSKWALTSELPCADSRTARPLSRVFAHVTAVEIGGEGGGAAVGDASGAAGVWGKSFQTFQCLPSVFPAVSLAGYGRGVGGGARAVPGARGVTARAGRVGATCASSRHRAGRDAPRFPRRARPAPR